MTWEDTKAISVLLFPSKYIQACCITLKPVTTSRKPFKFLQANILHKFFLKSRPISTIGHNGKKNLM